MPHSQLLLSYCRDYTFTLRDGQSLSLLHDVATTTNKPYIIFLPLYLNIFISQFQTTPLDPLRRQIISSVNGYDSPEDIDAFGSIIWTGKEIT